MCEMLDIAKSIISECNDKVKAKYGKTIKIDRVVINNYLTSVLGNARRLKDGSTEVHISGKAFRGHQHKSEFRNTVAHEFAHIADYQLFGGWDHGSSWKQVMVVLGEAAYERAPKFKQKELNKTERKTYEYVCGCKTHKVSGQVNGRIKRGGKYVCRSCKGTLKEKKS